MAPHKALIEVPRFLYTRATLPTATFIKITTQARTISTTRRTQPKPASRCQSRTYTSTATTSRPTRSNTLSIPSRAQAVTVKPSRPSTLTAPLRYNGTYAVVFQQARRTFATTRSNQKSHHFDTLKFVQRLKSEGFSEAQATAMMRVLNSVIEESIQNLTRTMVLKEQQERDTYSAKVDFAKLRSELSNADQSELSLTRSSHERLSSDLAKLSARLRDEIGRTQASVRLDLNLEKG